MKHTHNHPIIITRFFDTKRRNQRTTRLVILANN